MPAEKFSAVELFRERTVSSLRRSSSMPLSALDLNNVAMETSPAPQCSMAQHSNTQPSCSSKSSAVFYLEENSNSQDSGFEADRMEGCESKENEGFVFAAPRRIADHLHLKLTGEETCSPFKYSPIKHSSPMATFSPAGALNFSGEFEKTLLEEKCDNDSPLKVCVLTSRVDEDLGGDEGFLDVMDAEVAGFTEQSSRGGAKALIPPGGQTSRFNDLLTAPVLNKGTSKTQDDDTPVTRRVMCRRNIGHSLSMEPWPLSYRANQQKENIEPQPSTSSTKRFPSCDDSPALCQDAKRRRASSVLGDPQAMFQRPVLHRCHSESEALIKSAVARQANDPDLVGDCSKEYCLPTQSGKHQDLKSISGETMSQILDGCYDHEIEKAIVVDCRYPYEYNGGHIKGALNLYTHEQVFTKFLKTVIKPDDLEKRVVLIFHCEFSSERGPKLLRFLRSQDRLLNKDCYPHLHYPELYILEGGYKVYFETERHHCEPCSYKPMLHKDHSEDLRHFRIKSKSWAGEQRMARLGMRPLQF